jgi:hypothetical protein
MGIARIKLTFRTLPPNGATAAGAPMSDSGNLHPLLSGLQERSLCVPKTLSGITPRYAGEQERMLAEVMATFRAFHA